MLNSGAKRLRRTDGYIPPLRLYSFKVREWTTPLFTQSRFRFLYPQLRTGAILRVNGWDTVKDR